MREPWPLAMKPRPLPALCEAAGVYTELPADPGPNVLVVLGVTRGVLDHIGKGHEVLEDRA